MSAQQIELGTLGRKHPSREQQGRHQRCNQNHGQQRKHRPQRRLGGFKKNGGKWLCGGDKSSLGQGLQGSKQAWRQPTQRAQRCQQHQPRRQFGRTRHIARKTRLLQALRTRRFGTGKIRLLGHARLTLLGSLARCGCPTSGGAPRNCGCRLVATNHKLRALPLSKSNKID